MAAGRGHRRGRRPGLGRAGRCLPARRRLLRFPARNLRTRSRRQLAQLSLRLAVELFRAAVDCLRLHRPLQFSRLVLARTRCRAHRRIARAALLQLRRRGRLPAGHGAALSQPHLHHPPRLGVVCRRHGRHRRRHRLRLRPRRGHRRMAHASLARAAPFARCRRARAGHAHHHLRLLGLLQHLFPRQRSPPA